MAEKIEIEITEDNRELFKKATKEQIDIMLKTVGAEIERNATATKAYVDN